MDHFYVTLPSNSSKQYYGEQRLCQFKTKLARPLNLDVTEYEVGISEITYPHSWKNMPIDCNVIIGISNLQYDAKEKEYPIIQREFTVHKSHFKTVADLVSNLNKRLDKTFRKIKNPNDNIVTTNDTSVPPPTHYGVQAKYLDAELRYDPNVGKVYFSGNDHIYLQLPPIISKMLGFGDTAVILGSETLCPEILKQQQANCYSSGNLSCQTFRYPDERYNDTQIKLLKGQYIADVNRGLNSMYIYSPIVQSQFVGDTLAPLLRVIPLDEGEEFGQHVNHQFNNIYYLPLVTSFLDDIEVYIKDEAGDDMHFEIGRVVVVLHFKKT